MDQPRPWHRLFGLSWKDFFQDTPVTVETEIDLAQKLQLLDALLIRQGDAALPRRLPDGFEGRLWPFNVVGFKSHQEALDGWALNEHVGHYVNVRKQFSPSMQKLLPESDFALFAITVRSPRDLASAVPLTKVGQGVYEVRHFSGTMYVIVVHELPLEEHNAVLHLFSAKLEAVEYGAKHYRPRSREWTTLLTQFFAQYQMEGIPMSQSLEEYEKEALPRLLKTVPLETRLAVLTLVPRQKDLAPEELLKYLTPEELLKYLTPEEWVTGLSAEERVRGLTPEERLKGLPAEERVKGLSAEELVQGLPAETLAALVERLKVKQPAPKQE